VRLYKNFKISQHLAKLQARKLIASCTLTVCLGTVLLKDEELARYLEYGSYCYIDFDMA